MTAEILSAPLRMRFDYTRSTGPVLGRFLTELRSGRIVGVRGSDGRVIVPPAEFDPVTTEPLTRFVPVSDVGTVRTWSWVAEPLPGQPFDRPFAYALVELDGADTALLHAVDVAAPADMAVGMRVRARWAAERRGDIHDIVAFEPGDTSIAPTDSAAAAAGPVTGIVTPVDLTFKHTAAPAEGVFLRAIRDGRLLGARAKLDGKVYFPPRGADPRDGSPTEDFVEVSDTGIVTTFCIVNVPFLGQRIPPPYVAAYVLLDGADIPFLHLVLGCDASEVRMGMRVRAVWKPRAEWGLSMANIDHFRPTGAPDAAFETFAHHL